MSRTTYEWELDTLYQISTSINSHLELDEVLSETVRLVQEVTQGDSCLLYLLDEAKQELVLQAAKDPHPSEIGAIRLKFGEGITGWVAQEKEIVVISQTPIEMPVSSSLQTCRRTALRLSCRRLSRQKTR